MTYPTGVKPGALVPVSVRSIYKNYTAMLPERMAYMQPHAAVALEKLEKTLAAVVKNPDTQGLFVSDCYRSELDQAKAYIDYLAGRGAKHLIAEMVSKYPILASYTPRPKTAYSTPPGYSFHEAGLAIDLDMSFARLGVDQPTFAEIAYSCGWRDIVHGNFGNPRVVDVKEEWHWECLGEKWGGSFLPNLNGKSPKEAYKLTAKAAVEDIRGG